MPPLHSQYDSESSDSESSTSSDLDIQRHFRLVNNPTLRSTKRTLSLDQYSPPAKRPRQNNTRRVFDPASANSHASHAPENQEQQPSSPPAKPPSRARPTHSHLSSPYFDSRPVYLSKTPFPSIDDMRDTPSTSSTSDRADSVHAIVTAGVKRYISDILPDMIGDALKTTVAETVNKQLHEAIDSTIRKIIQDTVAAEFDRRALTTSHSDSQRI